MLHLKTNYFFILISLVNADFLFHPILPLYRGELVNLGVGPFLQNWLWGTILLFSHEWGHPRISFGINPIKIRYIIIL